jgi:hypothetical protein
MEEEESPINVKEELEIETEEVPCPIFVSVKNEVLKK